MSTADLKIFSVDSHVLFTDEWVTERLPQRLREPYVEANRKFREMDVAKRDGWSPDMCDLFDETAWYDPGHTEPVAKIASMDRDGVWAEVIFPEVGAARVCNPELLGNDWSDVLSGYNDAISDFASVDRERLLCAYQIVPHDIEKSVAEVKRLAKMGARCIQLPPFPSNIGLKDYCDPSYYPLWEVVQEADITLLQHLDQNSRFHDVLKRDPTRQKAIALGLPWTEMAETLAFWLLSGVLEDFPRLRVLFVEPGLGWLPFMFDTVLDGRIVQGHYKFPKLKMLPSEYFKRQMGATFMYEPVGLKSAYEYFGADCIFWSTDFPHPATSWPHSVDHIEKQFTAAGIPEADKVKIISTNGMRVFGNR